jgi:hypothetical protein
MRNMQTTTYSLHIPKPCHQGWQKMQPSDGGRYCNHCSKTVVDFTQMSDEAIQQYFIQRQSEGVCGHFKTTQLQRVRITLPGYVLQRKLRGWQKFLVMLLLCFGSNFMGIDVLWGGNGNALYAQTVTKSKGVAKAKKSKKQKRRLQSHISIAVNRNFWPEDVIAVPPNGEYFLDGIVATKPEPNNAFPKFITCQTENDSSIDKCGKNSGPTITDQASNQQKKETPPQNIPLQRKEYLPPLAWRRRKKR